MSIQLPDVLVQEIEKSGSEPLRVENPRNHKSYLIIAEDDYQGAAVRSTRDVLTDERTVGDGWTQEKNSRRFELIDKEIVGALNVTEAAELDSLQHQIDDYLRRVAPLPLVETRLLHDRLRQQLAESSERSA